MIMTTYRGLYLPIFLISLLPGRFFKIAASFAPLNVATTISSVRQQNQQQNPPPSTTRILHVHSKIEKSEDTEEEQSNDGKRESLCFSAVINISSDPLPEGTSKADVSTFLQTPETRNSLLSSGGTRSVEEVPMSSELESLWVEFCEEEYGNENFPEPGDCILSCDSIIQFPGLKMVTTTYSGVKFGESDAGFPNYSFFLIGEKQSISGLPPVVYIFNKLTGADKKGDSLKPSGVATSVVSVMPNEDGKFVFNFDANIKITVGFPAFLLKILPTNKEKAEAQGSNSIMKSLKPSIEKSTKAIYDDFIASRVTS